MKEYIRDFLTCNIGHRRDAYTALADWLDEHCGRWEVYGLKKGYTQEQHKRHMKWVCCVNTKNGAGPLGQNTSVMIWNQQPLEPFRAPPKNDTSRPIRTHYWGEPTMSSREWLATRRTNG